MTKVPKPDNWSAAYDLVYDAWNRLVTVRSGSTTVATYFYDGTNRRIKKIVGSETRLFYFNQQWQCLEEYVGSTCNIRFVWGLRYVDDLVTYRNASTDYYVLQDANWNGVALTNASGVVQERYTYSAFGKLHVFDASFIPKSASTFSLTRSFTGQLLDAETGLMLYRNRVYHPMLGRFLQRDPIGYQAKDVNLMRYVKGNPILFTDAKGLVPPPVAGCLAGALGAGVVSISLNVWNYLSGRKSGCEAIGDTLCDTATGCIAGAMVGAGGLGIGACIGVTSLSALLAAGCKSGVRMMCDRIRNRPGDCPKDPMTNACLAFDMIAAIGSSILACIGGAAKEKLLAFVLGADVASVSNTAC